MWSDGGINTNSVTVILLGMSIQKGYRSQYIPSICPTIMTSQMTSCSNAALSRQLIPPVAPRSV